MKRWDVVEGNGKERLVLSGIVIYWKNGKCVPCLTIFDNFCAVEIECAFLFSITSNCHL